MGVYWLTKNAPGLERQLSGMSRNVWHGLMIMRDQDSFLVGCQYENIRIRHSLKLGFIRGEEVHCRLLAPAAPDEAWLKSASARKRSSIRLAAESFARCAQTFA